MTPPRIVPCLWFDENAADGARLYAEVLPDARTFGTWMYPDKHDNPGGVTRGKELMVTLEAGGCELTLLNGGPHFRPNPSISFFVEVKSAEEVNRITERLLEGGKAMMALGSYPWSERYAWVADRFGFTWQVMLPRSPVAGAAIAPCMMFHGDRRGRAEEALRAYVDIFPESKVLSLSPYPEGAGSKGLANGRVSLGGQTFAATDSPIDHAFDFNEAVSFQVMCRDQQEIDHYYAILLEGGVESQCGWLKDRFGISWQIVPVQMSGWMTDANSPARQRTFEAMMKMKKLNIATLENAFNGD